MAAVTAVMLFTAVPANAAPQPDAVPAASTEPDPVDPPLLDATADGGTVRVNVVTRHRAALDSASEAGETLVSYDSLPLVTLRVDEAGLQRLNADPNVVSVSEDVPVAPALDESTLTIGSDRTFAAGKTGAGTTVAVLDTGVAVDHPFLSGRVTGEACFSVTDASVGSTSLCPDGTGEQVGPGSADVETGPCATMGAVCSHGTHVAGIVAGDGTGVDGAPKRGVAPDADVLAIQVFSKFTSDDRCGGAGKSPCVLSFTSSQVKALERVLALKRAGTDIVAANMSLGSGRWTSACFTDARKAIIDNLLAEGVATVVAAGNNGYAEAVNAPGCVPSALTVGSTTDDDQLSSFTNRGALLDLLAPGTGIVSSVPGGGFASKDGTSMAAPHVAGALAVLRQSFPEKSVTELEALLLESGEALTYTGAVTPRIQLDAAALGGGGGTDPEEDPELTAWDNWTEVTVPVSGSAESVIEIDQNRLAPSSLQVYVDVHRAGPGDLNIDLVAPDGSLYPLQQVRDNEVDAIHELYQVDASGEQANGTWKLRVTSIGAGGSISGWDLRFPWFDNWTETQIPDLGTVESPVVVGSARTGNAPQTTRVYVDIHHSWRGDLQLDLIAPDGRAYPLRAAAAKDSGDTIHEHYVVDARASLAKGTWKLRAKDTAQGNSGSISGWMLTL
ncbi:S8 family serine peptidase [Streptomyces sp. NPDC050842]|uniref:S8 family serine peptidase n=1 Tax=Streptomyces sp. NPDC050842 TaxID=3365636 RepID=UPI00378A4CEB